MKVKTSVTLSPGVLAAIDRVAGKGCSRSEFIERAVQDYVRRTEREARRAKEIELLNAIAEGRLGEPSDVLDYTAPITYEVES
jgi:metal-responsive CopG/Arc/MetJ family transcriptional regulator